MENHYHLISHVADRDRTMKYFESDNARMPLLRNLVREFCYNFNVKVGLLETKDSDTTEFIRSHLPYIPVYTTEGMPCGTLKVKFDHEGDYFAFSSPTISKEKASSRSDRNSRDSTTIKGLISALKRNKEIPSLERCMERYKYGIGDALRSTARNSGYIRLDLPTETIIELVKMYLGETTYAVSHDAVIREAYTNCVEQIDKKSEAEKVFNRFNEGCKGIGIIPTDEKPIYVVGDITWVGDTPKVTNITIHKSLNENARVAGDVMMIRTFMQGRTDVDRNNELGVRRADRYYEDLDIATGYSSHDCVWVLIPNRGE
jgi:hypothetical protein